jgi:hypothetical protein
LRLGRAFHQADGGERPKGKHEARQGGPGHVPYVGEDVDLGHGRGEIRGIGKWGELIAEIGSGDDGPSGDRQRKFEPGGYPDQTDAERARYRPGASDGERRHGAQETTRGVKHRWFEKQQPVIDHRGHGS